MSAFVVSRYKFIMPTERVPGLKQPDGSWSGLIGLLVKQDIDLALYDFTPTPDRQEAINFTVAFDESPYKFLVPKPQSNYKYLFLDPFTWDVSLSGGCGRSRMVSTTRSHVKSGAVGFPESWHI